jgi:4-diphosphocytidyl-2-C-methyl-D-erythritol kinase
LLKGLALSSGLAVDETKFQRCALSLGADVPYFLNGGLQLVEGVGERVTQIDTLGIGDVSVALVIPREPVPTPLAYQLFREARPDIPETPDPMRERIVSRGVFAEDPLSALQRLLRNDLQPVVESHFVGVREVVKVLSSLYPDRVLMTGSGACVFVLLREGEVGAFPRTVAGRLPDGTQTILSTLALDNWGSPLANSERLF